MAKSILIIEDDKNIAELERDYLEANGYEVDTKLNGESGLEAALKQNYNLILLDLMLPGMDGFEICRCIRREKDIPILMVSAKKEDIDKIRGFGIERRNAERKTEKSLHRKNLQQHRSNRRIFQEKRLFRRK